MSNARSRTAPLLALCLLAACGGGARGERPNVLLVTLDTTRPDYLSTYGYTPGHTPHFDALAADGTRFDNAVSASSVTPVSHASILTGLYPYNHGLRVLSGLGGFRLPRSIQPLSSLFKREGYRTGAVHSAYPVSGDFGFKRDYDWYESFDEAEMTVKQLGGDQQKTEWDGQNQRRSDDTTDLALGFLDGAGDEPFFLWIHYWDPHDPTLLPPEETAEFQRLLDSGVPPEEAQIRVCGTREEIYAKEVRYLDSQFGRLIDGLKQRGLYDDTVILVTADHGEGLADGVARHGWGAHRMVYKEQIQVPLILHAPGAPKNHSVASLVRTVDIAPTLLDLAGVGGGEGLDGLSLKPLVEGKSEAPRMAYADQINGYDSNASMVAKAPQAAFLYCVQDERWKLTYRPHMPLASELFDLLNDPLEEENAIRRYPEERRRLLLELARRKPWVLEPFEPDGEGEVDIAKLAALGYAPGTSPDLAWQWTCPVHMDLRVPSGETHEECGSPLIPVAIGK